MSFTAWNNDCPNPRCGQPIPAELSGLELDGFELTCPGCGHVARLVVDDALKAAMLLPASKFPKPAYLENGQFRFGGVLPPIRPHR
jgi:hypothetical protein